MAGSTSAVILCVKCAGPGTPAETFCVKCSGALAKVCGKCGFKNSVAKNYCDHCGTAMALLAPSAQAPQGGPAQGPAPTEQREIPQTVIRRIPASGAGAPPQPPVPQFNLPAAGRMAGGPPQAIDPNSVYAPGPATFNPASMTVMRRKDRKQNILFFIILAVVGALAWRQLDIYLKPENAVPRLAARYLDALSRYDSPAAYEMLSRDSKASCTEEEFKALRDPTPWTWSDLTLAGVETDVAVIKYQIKIEGKPPQEDFLFFLKEQGAWVRPFNWNLLKKAEEAIAQSNHDMALLVAQSAVRINPRDPMARGYLCEAVFYRKVPAETERECALALRLSQTYPSKLSLKSLYHLHAILGDTYKNSLRKFPEALEQYNAMLAFPALGQDDQCDILLARADTEAAMGKPAEAAADLSAAERICQKPEDVDFIRQRRTELFPR